MVEGRSWARGWAPPSSLASSLAPSFGREQSAERSPPIGVAGRIQCGRGASRKDDQTYSAAWQGRHPPRRAGNAQPVPASHSLPGCACVRCSCGVKCDVKCGVGVVLVWCCCGVGVVLVWCQVWCSCGVGVVLVGCWCGVKCGVKCDVKCGFGVVLVLVWCQVWCSCGVSGVLVWCQVGCSVWCVVLDPWCDIPSQSDPIRSRPIPTHPASPTQLISTPISPHISPYLPISPQSLTHPPRLSAKSLPHPTCCCLRDAPNLLASNAMLTSRCFPLAREVASSL